MADLPVAIFLWYLLILSYSSIVHRFFSENLFTFLVTSQFSSADFPNFTDMFAEAFQMMSVAEG